ncbi:MAG: hypothetical protein ABL958_10915 [Bdellovibrionia bacterium]
MELMILVGVWSLAFGHITVTNSLKMKGNEARVYGLALIIIAAYGFPYLNGFFGGLLPKFLAGNAAVQLAYPGLIGAFAIYATGWAQQRIFPKLRIPSVTVSLKQARKAA